MQLVFTFDFCPSVFEWEGAAWIRHLPLIRFISTLSSLPDSIAIDNCIDLHYVTVLSLCVNEHNELTLRQFSGNLWNLPILSFIVTVDKL